MNVFLGRTRSSASSRGFQPGFGGDVVARDREPNLHIGHEDLTGTTPEVPVERLELVKKSSRAAEVRGASDPNDETYQTDRRGVRE